MSHTSTELKHSEEWAVYLPALSSFYTKMLETVKKPNARTIDGIPDISQLDFINPNSNIFFYKYGLYSAGHAQLDLDKTDATEPMVQKRDRTATTIVGDSGGFQIATGVLKMDWANVKGEPGDVMREKLLRWLEHTADWSMTLDVPAFAAEPPLSEKTGLTKFEDTLDISVHNLHYFVKNRVPGKTKFLNVLSGSSVENAKIWYNAVTPFSKPNMVEEMGYTPDRTLEGYAFAGINMRNMYSALSLLLSLIEDDLIKDKDWIHFLGTGKASWACYLTSIQKRLRKWYNPNITVSFDAASPFVATAYGQCYNYNRFTPAKWGFSMDRAIDCKDLAFSEMPMPFTSRVMDKLKVSDICVYANEHTLLDGKRRFDINEDECAKLVEAGLDAKWVPASTNKNGKVGNTSWDSMSYLLYMAHNVHNHITAVQESNKLADVEIAKLKPDYRNWSKDKKAVEISCFVPHTILHFDSFVDKLLDPKTTDKRKMLDDYKTLLDTISFGSKRNDSFNNLFNVDSAADNDENKFADMNDEKLEELEHNADDE